MKFKVIILLVFVILFSGCKKEDEYVYLRTKMVENQLKARDITDKHVLKVMSEVERHEFVPSYLRHLSYNDTPLPIGYGQTISQPYIVALMTQLADIDKNDKVLEIGTGSGYQAAILAELANYVYSIEILEPLAEKARKKLKRLGYGNVKIECGDGYKGLPEFAPFDVIIVTCAPVKVPLPLIKQLKSTGRLVIPVGKQFQNLKLIKKSNDNIEETIIIPVRFVEMTGEGVENFE